MGLFKKNHSAEPATTPGSGNWQVGDYYNANGKEGVVIWVDETGRYIKIVHLEEAELPWSDIGVKEVATDATDQYDGRKNLELVSKIQDWRYNFPAFTWCAVRGEGWYLPASEELNAFIGKDSKEILEKVNCTLKKKGGKKIGGFLGNSYWSSTESEDWYVHELSSEAKEKLLKRNPSLNPEDIKPTRTKKAMIVRSGYTIDENPTSTTGRVRAVAMIDTELSVGVEHESPAPAVVPVDVPVDAIWKVGDHYNVNGKEGVVFWVDATGKHGKIVSVDQNNLVLFRGVELEDKKLARSASDENDGMKNQQEVMKIHDWQIVYCAHDWCAEHGSGWYLPATNEVKDIMQTLPKVNETLSQLNREIIEGHCWSSTFSKGKLNACVVRSDGQTVDLPGMVRFYVRAVSAF